MTQQHSPPVFAAAHLARCAPAPLKADKAHLEPCAEACGFFCVPCGGRQTLLCAAGSAYDHLRRCKAVAKRKLKAPPRHELESLFAWLNSELRSLEPLKTSTCFSQAQCGGE
jgi:hypothetical protein